MRQLIVMFLTGSLTQNIYSGKFCNVNNEFYVTNVKKLNISFDN